MCAFPVPPEHVPAQRREPMPAARAAPASVAYWRFPGTCASKRHPCWHFGRGSCSGGQLHRWGWLHRFTASVIRLMVQSVQRWQAFRCQCVACPVGTGLAEWLQLPQHGLERQLLLLQRAFIFTVHSESCWHVLNKSSHLKIQYRG